VSSANLTPELITSPTRAGDADQPLSAITRRDAGVSVFNDTAMLVLWIGLLVFSGWTMRDAWADIIGIVRNDEEQSHVILVPIVAIWMAWIRRGRLRRLRPTGTLVGPVIMAVGWLMSWFGYHHAVQSCWHAGAVVVMIGAAIVGLGVNTLFKLFPAFVVLAFAVPVPGAVRQAISGPLQTASAWATQIVLETFGVPLERSMNLLTLNGHDIAVAEACNGMRMVLALILVSFAFAFSMPLKMYARVLVLLASPLAALLCNIIRLVPTVLLYGYASKSTADAFHDISGWLMVPLAFAVLLGVTAVMRWAMIPVAKFNLAYQ
jgi:exosortase